MKRPPTSIQRLLRFLPALSLAAIVITTSMTDSNAAANSIDKVVDVVTKEVRAYALQKKALEAPIFVDPVTMPPKFNSSGGHSLRVALRDGLAAKGLAIAKREREAKWFLRGRCLARSGSNDLTLVIEIVDVNNVSLDVIRNLIEKFEDKHLDPPKAAIKELNIQQAPNAVAPQAAATLDDLIDLNRLKGFTGDLSTHVSKHSGLKLEGTNHKAENDFAALSPSGQDRASIAAQKALNSIVGTRIPGQKVDPRPNGEIGASKNSLFSLKLLVVNPDGSLKTCDIRPDDINSEFLFTQLKKNDRYVIEIKNRSTHDAGVMVTVDGVNTLYFAEEPKYKRTKEIGKWFVPAQEAIYISGWFLNERDISEFLVVPEPNGVVAQEGLDSVADVGMISAEFYYATQDHNEFARYDMLMAHATKGAGELLATGLGPKRNADTKMVRNIRFGTNPLALITIRYDRPDVPPANLPNDF